MTLSKTWVSRAALAIPFVFSIEILRELGVEVDVPAWFTP
jgi:hypothetical protein